MPIGSQEYTASGSRAAELYEFVGDGVTLRFTSLDRDYTYDGHTWTKAPINRRSIARASLDEKPPEVEIVFKRSILNPLLTNGLPPRSFRLTITRAQPGGAQQMWSGDVAGISGTGVEGHIRVPSQMDDTFSAAVPNVLFKRNCNHPVYSSRCQAVRTDHDLATTVVSVDDKTIVVTAVGLHPVGEVQANGEKHMVVEQSGLTLVLAMPFRDLDPSDAITLYDKCDQTPTVCKNVFDNIENYSGSSFVPLKNVFQSRSGFRALMTE